MSTIPDKHTISPNSGYALVDFQETEMNKILNPGQIVWLDADMVNSSKVEVVKQSPGRKFTTVKDEDSEWQVMTYRLTNFV